VFKADEWLRKSGLNGNAAIVKATPKLRQHFCRFLQVDRDRTEGNWVPCSYGNVFLTAE